MTFMEQPDDWTEPGAHAVRPGVYRVPLPLPEQEGLQGVNAYVIDGSAGPVIIDSGWACPATEKVLAHALHTLGHRLEDVAEVLVTHAHWDHYTQALALRDLFGSRVRIGRGEQHSIEHVALASGFYTRQVELLRACGAEELSRRIATLEIKEHERDVPYGPPDAWLDHGERVDLGTRSLEVIATPGHTRGHVVFRDEAAGLLFAGDHVLPRITPSLGLEPAPEPKPLRSYLASLKLVRDLPDALLLSAHGAVTSSVHTRIDELLEHHRARLQETLDAVAAGAETAHDVANSLPWTRHMRRLTDLDVTSQMMAVTETHAHLDVLADRGLLMVGEDAGVLHYSPG